MVEPNGWARLHHVIEHDAQEILAAQRLLVVG
jgi:hypothetical protein